METFFPVFNVYRRTGEKLLYRCSLVVSLCSLFYIALSICTPGRSVSFRVVGVQNNSGSL
jgi:hypothetical protein